jgi:hypothetical protein
MKFLGYISTAFIGYTAITNTATATNQYNVPENNNRNCAVESDSLTTCDKPALTQTGINPFTSLMSSIETHPSQDLPLSNQQVNDICKNVGISLEEVETLFGSVNEIIERTRNMPELGDYNFDMQSILLGFRDGYMGNLDKRKISKINKAFSTKLTFYNTSFSGDFGSPGIVTTPNVLDNYGNNKKTILKNLKSLFNSNPREYYHLVGEISDIPQTDRSIFACIVEQRQEVNLRELRSFANSIRLKSISDKQWNLFETHFDKFPTQIGNVNGDSLPVSNHKNKTLSGKLWQILMTQKPNTVKQILDQIQTNYSINLSSSVSSKNKQVLLKILKNICSGIEHANTIKVEISITLPDGSLSRKCFDQKNPTLKAYEAIRQIISNTLQTIKEKESN